MTTAQQETVALQRYLAHHVETATPVQRLLMLFDYLAKDFAGARAGFAEGNFEQISTHLIHAQEILFALRDPLDATTDLGRSLAALYEFAIDRLVVANFRKQIGPLDEVQPLIDQVAAANRLAAAAVTKPAVAANA
jgi:flagellar protein FliS